MSLKKTHISASVAAFDKIHLDNIWNLDLEEQIRETMYRIVYISKAKVPDGDGVSIGKRDVLLSLSNDDLDIIKKVVWLCLARDAPPSYLSKQQQPDPTLEKKIITKCEVYKYFT